MGKKVEKKIGKKLEEKYSKKAGKKVEKIKIRAKMSMALTRLCKY